VNRGTKRKMNKTKLKERKEGGGEKERKEIAKGNEEREGRGDR
jgi:hypothetical protein